MIKTFVFSFMCHTATRATVFAAQRIRSWEWKTTTNKMYNSPNEAHLSESVSVRCPPPMTNFVLNFIFISDDFDYKLQRAASAGVCVRVTKSDKNVCWRDTGPKSIQKNKRGTKGRHFIRSPRHFAFNVCGLPYTSWRGIAHFYYFSFQRSAIQFTI